MTSLHARRVEIDPLDAGSRESLERIAARRGVLHRTSELVVTAFGTAATIGLDGGLAATGVPALVAGTLQAIPLSGDDGPGGSGVVAMGALPFDASEPTALVVPSLVAAWHPRGGPAFVTSVVRASEVPDPFDALSAVAAGDHEAGGRTEVVEVHERPSAAAYEDAVRRCLVLLRSGGLDKVVLARARVGRCAAPIDVAAVAAALHANDPRCDLYAYPTPPGRFVGASPELIVATSAGAVSAHPLAGTVALGRGSSDEVSEAWLLASEKNRHEHRVVVDDVVARLGPLCDTVGAEKVPHVVRLSTDARLGTWVDGKLRGGSDPAAALAALAALHPTPAVAGTPRAAALEVIAAREPVSRGPWAGAVGWLDQDGTSTWTLGLRGVRVDGAGFEVWAGAGIVAASVPAEERQETEDKLASVLRVLSP